MSEQQILDRTDMSRTASNNQGQGAVTLDKLLIQLASQGLVQPTAEHPLPAALAPKHDAESSPWYVKLLVGIAAWMSAVFLGLFFSAAGLIDSWQSMLIWGSIIGVGALVLKRSLRHSIFWGQLAFALILAGQGLFLAGMSDVVDGGTDFVLVIIGLELALFALYPDVLHRLLSLLVVIGALVYLIYDFEVLTLLHGLIWLCGLCAVAAWQLEWRLLASRLHPFRVPLTYGFAFALLGLCLIPYADFLEITAWWPTTAGLALLLLYVASRILTELDVKLVGLVGLWSLGALALLLIPAYNTPGILAAMLILVLAYWRNNGLLTGLGGIFLLFFLSIYYYNLELTLDEKSYILMGTGVVLLGARLLLHRVINVGETK